MAELPLPLPLLSNTEEITSLCPVCSPQEIHQPANKANIERLYYEGNIHRVHIFLEMKQS
jgi:hypothetical protein